MMFIVYLLGFFSAFCHGLICSELAQRYRKNKEIWFHLGFLFGLIALFFLVIKNFFEQRKLKTKPIFVNSTTQLTSIPLEKQKLSNESEDTSKPDHAIEAFKWHLLDDKGFAKGPVSFDELKDLIEKGQVSEKSLLWTKGLQKWTPFSKLSYLKLVLESKTTSSL